MITREQIHELAQFEDSEGCAISFYSQPTTPRNKAHKEEAILTKDLIREALRRVEATNTIKENYELARRDLDRIVELSRELRSNGTHAKAVFACSGRNFWREYDLPAQLAGSEVSVSRRFQLKPLAHLLGAFPALGVVLLDRRRARLFDLRLGELTEREDFFHALPRRGRSDGFAGYDGGHAERRVADEVRQHFKNVAEVLKNALEQDVFERWILGCLETHWSEFEALMHPEVAQKLLGRFNAEVAHATRDEIRSHAEQIFAEWQGKRCSELVHEAIGQARANGRGVTGLKRVLQSLELGEVQIVLVGENYMAQAIECPNCGHLDAHLVNTCPVCGHETREIVDVSEALLPRVIRQNIELFYVKNPDLDAVGNIAALLRFRSEQNTNVRSINEARPSQPPRRGEGFVARSARIDHRMIL
jgi:peptide chain release factor subunit 1